MTVQQGLKSLAESNPNFSNQGVQNAIADTNIGFVIKTKELAYMIDINSTLTESQKSDLYDVLETQSYLNIGRYLQDLDNHTFNILNGSLGEASETDTTTPTFLEHLGAVDAIQGSYFTLYGVDASNSNKGVDDFFGTLRGTTNNNLKNIKNAVQSITAASLSEDTNYQDATQDILDFINTLGDSSTFDESTFNSLLSAFETASNNFNTILSTTYPNQKTILIENRSIIQEQITKEENNLGSIRTYSESLANLITYQGLSRNDTIRDLLSKTAQTPAWNDYFENYQTRFNQQNPIYNNSMSDSATDEIINTALRLKGLPDVKDYVDLVSVAKKALRDIRLKTKINDSGKNVVQIIKESCEKLGINIAGKDVYAQSESLLNNMNNNDKEIIRQELSLHQQVNTLS
jgi:hypothetical protein